MNLLSWIIFIVGIVIIPLLFRSFIMPKKLRQKPVYALITAATFTLIGFVASFFIFSSAISIVMIAFSSLLMLPYVMKVLEPEKKKKKKSSLRHIQKDIWSLKSWYRVFQEHDKVVLFYIFLFFGMALEYTLLFALLPPGISDAAFSQQLEFLGPAGSLFNAGLFWKIIENNIQILLICFAFSIFYGAGSIFVLNYNASIVGVIYGMGIKTMIWGGSAGVFANPLIFLPHTILEVLAYLLAAMGGGILSKDPNDPEIQKDTMIIFLISLLIVFLAGFVEVTFPMLFM